MWEKFWVALVVTTAVTLGSIPVVTAYKAIFSDGKVAYCYVNTYTYHAPSQADVVIYDVSGFRPWREDRKLTQKLKSLDEVVAAAKHLNCEIR